MNDVYIPLVFCLLPNKTTQSYEKVLRAIIEECKKLNLHLFGLIFVDPTDVGDCFAIDLAAIQPCD